MNLAGNLNSAQYDAVSHKDGPLLIVAGAGAGKTKTITHRIIHLIKNGVSPQEILAITFTNKAATEMRDRVRKLLKISPNDRFSSGNEPHMSTFHSLGAKILRENSKTLGLKKHFSIFDKEDSLKIIKEALKGSGLDPKTHEPRKILNLISKEKGNGITLEDYLVSVDNDYFRGIIGQVWMMYEEIKKEQSGLDFDDLILKTNLLLKRHPLLLHSYQDRWKYIHVDEYQDTNHAQYEMVTLLSNKHRNICVVGDSDQSIYSWRGADYNNILNFEYDYPGAQVVTLEENYRSTKSILSAAEEIIKKNKKRKEKKLFTHNKVGEKIRLHVALDENEEAQFVAEETKKLIGGGVESKEIGVLYRTNFQSRVLEEYFLRENIPYSVVGVRFFERKEIKDVLAFIRVALNRNDRLNTERIINIPPRGIGKVTLLKIFSGKENSLSSNVYKKVANFRALIEDLEQSSAKRKPSEFIKYVIKKTGIETSLMSGTLEDMERLENIKELVTLATKYDVLEAEDGILQLLSDASLMVNDQDDTKNGGGVKLMTVHSAKGLEFSHVFVTGLEKDLFPHIKIDDDDPEEERRLFYVALTRAKEKLYLTYSHSRTIFGSKEINVPSEFLLDISENLLETQESSEKIITLD